MKNDWKSFCLLPLIPIICVGTALNSLGPPSLLPEAYVAERVVPAGAKVQLACPAQAEFFEWFRGNEAINIFHEDRFRVQKNGVLKIKSAAPQDSGVYICRAINGFGSLDTNITLVVLADVDGDMQAPNSGNFQNPVAVGCERERPYLTNVTRTSNGRLRKLLGSPLRLLCKAAGCPEPQVAWLKNGHILLNSSLFPGSKRSRWSLYIHNLQESDRGNFTCLAYNIYGHINHTVNIDVVTGSQKKPEMQGLHPVNTTVEEGGTAVLQCRIKSDQLPHVQWLKQTDPSDVDAISVHGEYFLILRSSEIRKRADGTFLNKLIIEGASQNDAGKYICLGANAVGYSSRTAFLTIRGPSETYIAEMEGISIQLSPLFISIPILLGIIITLLAVIGLHFQKRPRDQGHALYDGKNEKASVATHEACNGSLQALDSSDRTWSHIQSSLVIDPDHPDTFSDCDSSFVFLGNLNIYPDNLYSPIAPTQDTVLCLDRV